MNTAIHDNVAPTGIGKTTTSCIEWEKRRMLWLYGMFLSDVLCDTKSGKQQRKQLTDLQNKRVISYYTSCYFTNNRICLDIQQQKWIFNNHTKIYNNLRLLHKDNQNIPNSIPSKTFNINILLGSVLHENSYMFKDLLISEKPLHLTHDNTYYEQTVTLLAAHTRIPNIGHILFDDYFAALIAFDNWYKCGITRDTQMNLLLENSINTMIDQTVGNILFHKITNKTEIFEKYKNSKIKYVCFDKLIIGSGNENYLDGGLFLKQRMLKFLRNKLLTHFDIDPFFKPNEINILLLKKQTSKWKHNNFIENFDEIKQWIINDDTLTNIKHITIINPVETSFQKQVELISKASIVICLWGGIGFYNFLAPLNTVEIIITNWFKEKFNYSPENSHDIIPDYDMNVRDSISTQYTLRYWNLSAESVTPQYIDQTIMMNLIHAALDHLQYHFNYSI